MANDDRNHHPPPGPPPEPAAALPPAPGCGDDPEVVFHHLAQHTGGGLVVRRGTAAWIVVDPALGDRERRCVIAHERAHLARGPLITGPGAHPAWQVVVAREEHLVDQHAADHLVPPGELARVVNDWMQEGTPVEVQRVAEAFGVTLRFAEIALAGLARQPRR